VTYLDFVFFELLEVMDHVGEGIFFAQHPTLQEYSERIKQLPKFSEFWADDEKCMKSPFNNVMAKLNN